jgi:hypothetical protein
MGGSGSIPGWLLVPAAFVLLFCFSVRKSGPREYQAGELKSAEEEGDAYGSRQVDTLNRD